MSEIDKLLDYEEVAGYKIKPWGIVSLSELSPCFERILIALKGRGVTAEDAVSNIDKILFAILPEAPKLLSITLKLTIEEVDKISLDKVSMLIMAIVRINLAYLKNLLPLMTAAITEVTHS